MSKKYLQLDWKSSTLYEYSKDKKNEEYEEHINTKGEVSYRNYYNKGVTGELLNVGVRETKIGDQITVSLKVDEDYVNIDFPLYDQSSFVDDNYATSLIRFLGNMKKGNTYRIFPYNLTADTLRESDINDGKEPRAKYYDSRGVSVKQVVDGELKQVTPTLAWTGEGDSVIPKVKWIDNKAKPGKKKKSAASAEQKSEYLLEKLMESVDGHLKYDGNSGSNNTTSTPPPAQTTFETIPAEEATFVPESDDLPF